MFYNLGMGIDSHLLFSISLAFVSGVLPALIWLWFWTRQDKEKPEPKSMIALAFLGGTIAVFISLFLEKYLYSIGLKEIFSSGIFSNTLHWFENIAKNNNLLVDKVLLVIVFAPIIEELAKFIMAYFLVLNSKYNDEPLDPMIYMIATALGFAAIENTLFLISIFEKNNIILSVYTGNMRFIGATLLHTISSTVIGIFMSLHFFDKKVKKRLFIILGIVCSIVIHAIFNYLMIGNQKSCMLALELIWITVIIVLLIFEKIKKIKLEKI